MWALTLWVVLAVANEQHGRGYSVEAARALCNWGWTTLDVH
ncbi:hypothetical protein ACVB8X_43320 [Streptomyces sp. NRAIS4]